MSNSKPSRVKVKIEAKSDKDQAQPVADEPTLDAATETEEIAPEPEAKTIKLKLATSEPAAEETPPEPSQPEPTVTEPHEKPAANIKRVRKPIAVPNLARRSNLKFLGWTAVTVLAAGGLVASLWPTTLRYARSQANTLVAMGKSAPDAEAHLDYHLANILDPANLPAARIYASDQLSHGDASGARDTINGAGGAGESDRITLELKIRAQLESADAAGAANTATHLSSLAPTDDQIVTIALAEAAAGEGSGLAALEARVSSPQALVRIKRAEAGNASLAGELAASGLLRSSSAMLERLPSSAPRNLLLARVQAAIATKTSLQAAANSYSTYLEAMPADPTARLAYADVLTKLKQTDAASHQRSLAASLIGGQP